MIYRGVCIETNQMKGGHMPRVGHVMFGEDSFGRGQAKVYSELSGVRVEPSPEIDIIIKGESERLKLNNLGEVIEWYGGW